MGLHEKTQNYPGSLFTDNFNIEVKDFVLFCMCLVVLKPSPSSVWELLLGSTLKVALSPSGDQGTQQCWGEQRVNWSCLHAMRALTAHRPASQELEQEMQAW